MVINSNMSISTQEEILIMTVWPLCYQAPIISGQGASHSRINSSKILLGECGLGRNDPHIEYKIISLCQLLTDHIYLFFHMFTPSWLLVYLRPLPLWKIHFQYLSTVLVYTFVLLPLPLACFVFPAGGLQGWLLVNCTLSVSNPYLQLSSFKWLCLQLKSKHSFTTENKRQISWSHRFTLDQPWK